MAVEEAASCLWPRKLRAAAVLLPSPDSPRAGLRPGLGRLGALPPTAEEGTHTRGSPGLPRGLTAPSCQDLLGDRRNAELRLSSPSPHCLSRELVLHLRPSSLPLFVVEAGSRFCGLRPDSSRQKGEDGGAARTARERPAGTGRECPAGRAGSVQRTMEPGGEGQRQEARGLAPGSDRPSRSTSATWS